MSGDRVGLLIIRVWIEGGSSAPLRAHIRHTTDLSAGLQDGATVTDETAVAAVVRGWLRDVVRDGAPPPLVEPAP
jgi:hypothetical protein